MADPATKKTLQELAKDESLKNKTCVDCGNPNPQWASISFAVFICLQCAGTHRGFGVHISFVRSVSMDAWQDEQLRRMKLGGNAPLMQFLREYPPEGGFTEGMSTHDKYHCWAATQYREKLTAALDGKDWAPSPAPPPESNTADAPGRPSSAQGLRKSRTSARASPSALRQNSNSPASTTPSPLSNSAEFGSADRKSANETYFASLGASNASRPDHLPPSQGGRYGGFGSTPPPSEHLSSASTPTFTELQSDPVRALSKGWSLFAGAVAGASRAVSENVIQPGMERVADPELRERVGGIVSSAGQRASAAAGTANAWGRQQFGVDVGENLGAVVDKVKGVAGGRPEGYEAVGQWGAEEHEGSALYQDAHEDDFFKDNGEGWQDMPSAGASSVAKAESAKEGAKAKADDWDEWKEF